MRLSIKQYAILLDKALAEADTDHAKEKVTKDFAALVENDGRSSRLSDILLFWKDLYNKRHGIIDVEIQTAEKETAAFPHSFAGKKVALKVTENPALIGGSIIKIGDYEIDASLRTKINALRN